MAEYTKHMMSDNSKIMKIAFFKPEWDDFVGQGIAWYTKIFNWKAPLFSHVEIGFFVDGNWQWYSSASRKNKGGRTGTRWLTEDELFVHPERWAVFDVKPVRPLWDMLKMCDEELGKSYDWAGIMGFVTIFGQLNLKKNWYCSEICHYVFFGKWKKRVSPERFFHEIKKYFV